MDTLKKPDTSAVDKVLADFTAQFLTSQYYIAFSGGLDSTVLLYALSKCIPCENITAVHVHHGLLAAADSWLEHCRDVCKTLNITCQTHKLTLPLQAGDSVEQVARQARYRVFHTALQRDDLLLTAHHVDDQAETFLLQALRGAGVAGLSAMPVIKPFGLGQHGRPFLSLAKQQLSDYAEQHALSWVNDPSNNDDRFNRNYLRQHIMPVLQQRWPGMSATLSRSATLLAENQELLTELAAVDTGLQPGEAKSLSIKRLLSLSTVRRLHALRYWLKQYVPVMPSLAVLKQIDQAMFVDHDARPEIQVDRYIIRRYRGQLYCICDSKGERVTATALKWDITAPLYINTGLVLQPDDLGSMLTTLQAKGAQLEVRFRQGGERILLAGRQHRHQVKKLLQERAVPPWLRGQLPMIYYQGRLIAILGLSPPILSQI